MGDVVVSGQEVENNCEFTKRELGSSQENEKPERIGETSCMRLHLIGL
ncbi:10154_t:CDS:2, partial [Acaulospora colombiana]